ncbi:MAG TPA: periplasmic heavy metal sensor [Gemmatimonadales bacterium]|nr:periplasmic heavy metal sensor [Gemmatimonadales bacterium]
MMSSRARAVVLLSATFLVGLVVGLVGGRWIRRGPFDRPSGRPTPVAMADRLSRRLDLRPEQRDSVRAILERHRPTMDSLWSEFRPRIRAVEESLQREIAAQLDPAQQEKFAKLRERYERMRAQPPGPPGPPPESPSGPRP